MTDDELKELAKAVWAGDVFTDRQLPPHDARLTSMVFMTLGFMKQEDLEKLTERIGKHGMIYEYMNKALERGINGYPMFFSAHVLSDEEGQRFWPIYDRLRELMEKL